MIQSSSQDKLIAQLFRIIRFGDVDMCVRFVKKNFPANENWCRFRHSKSGDSVPIIASAHGHISVLSLCSDADLESSNKDGKRPLHAAAQSSHVECVRYLLSRHVSVDCLKRADWYVVGVDFSYGTLLKIYIHKLNGLIYVYVNNICYKYRARVNNSSMKLYSWYKHFNTVCPLFSQSTIMEQR